MRQSASCNMTTLSVLLLAGTTWAQGTKYGGNHVRTSFDSQTVEQRAFPAPNVTLYSPAFQPNTSFAPGWYDGTEGATSQTALGTVYVILEKAMY